MRKVAERERMLKRPCSVKVDAWAWGETESRKETFATAPLQLKMQIPMRRLKATSATVLMMSLPRGISITMVFMALSDSRVMQMGGLGLFFEPTGRPLGLFPALVFAARPLRVSSSCSSTGGWGGGMAEAEAEGEAPP